MNHLSWKDHISTVANKISKTIGIISKSKFCLSQSSLFQLYYSIVYPYLYYGNIVWGATYKFNLRRFTVLQKRIVRIITRSPFDAHTAPLFCNYKLLTLDNIHSFQVALLMFSVETKTIPKSFYSMFSKKFENHHYTTRQSNDYRILFSRINLHKFSIVSASPALWNSLLSHFKSKSLLHSFRKKIKQYLINLNKT